MNRQHESLNQISDVSIALTMGDPGGIGPEVVVRALDHALTECPSVRFRVFAHRNTIEQVARECGVCGVLCADNVAVIEPAGVESLGDVQLHKMRTPNKRGGYMSMRCVEAAIRACLSGAGDAPGAMVTAPISKSAWKLAGFDAHPGHTELLADRCKKDDVRMAFVSPQLRVVLETIHVPLRDVPDALDTNRIVRTIEMAADLCRRLGIVSPRIAVAGVNPHAGEQGMMGSEDALMIGPAVALARACGFDVTGPHPGDTVFLRALRGVFDIVIAMYHDQGLIPVKLLAWDKAVNVTLGLPIVRTSPDHGTAFDIAGQSKADAGSMIAAIRLAIQLAQ